MGGCGLRMALIVLFEPHAQSILNSQGYIEDDRVFD